ncbi:glycoprotein integral membrane protein 1, partial [Notothenia coriiceps]|uniref:Glycoprotein integral membrane protein 1 n=1 Tax=Notothenia coriiceps TaxID=8208 RepID=A0A6I9MVX9_9TELE
SSFPVDSINGSSEFESGDLVSTVTRVMVSQNRLYSDTEEVLALQVFSEVIEMEGKEVQQPDMCEVKILMSPDFQKLAQFTNIYPIGHSEIFRLPRENDMVVTDPPNPRKDEEQLISQTTSQYPLKHTETTQEEVAAPGKLPETPLRMDPDLLYDVRYDDDEFDVREPSQPDHIQMEIPPKKLISSYSAVCQWVEELRERLRRFSSESLPLFFLVMWVVVIGVVGSAVIVKILDMFFPTCEHKHIFHLNPLTLMPEDEKQTLLENIEIEAEEEEEEKMP